MRHESPIADKQRAYDALQAARASDSLGNLYLDIVYAVMRVHLQPGDGVVQGGAYYGAKTAVLAKCVWPTGRVWAFEPQVTTHAGCLRLLSEADLQEVVDLSPVALFGQSGRSSFHIFPAAPGLSSILPRRLPLGMDAERTVTEVVTGCVDDLLPADARISAVVLDIEGCEFPALRGARATLERSRPLVALENARQGSALDYGYSAADLFAYFDELEYDLFDCLGFSFGMDDWGVRGQPWWYFALPREAKALSGIVHGVIDSVLERGGLVSVLP